jgi:hypothetical protein
MIQSARNAMKQHPGNPLSFAVSATHYGLLYRAIVFWNHTAINAFYAPCPDLRPQDNVQNASLIEDDMCPTDVKTALRRPYHCILASYYDLDRRQHVLTQLIYLDAQMMQTEVDRQLGKLDVCGTQHGTQHVYRGTCL